MNAKQFSLLIWCLSGIFLSAITTPAAAQEVSLRPYAGITASFFPDKGYILNESYIPAENKKVIYQYDASYEHSTRAGLVLGASLQYTSGKKFGLQTSFALHQSSYALKHTDTLHYLELYYGDTVLIRDLRTWSESKNTLTFFTQSLQATFAISPQLTIAAGPYASILVYSFEENPMFAPPYAERGYTTVYTNSSRPPIATPGSSDAQEELKKEGYGYRREQFGISAEVSYSFKRLVASVQAQRSFIPLLTREADKHAAIYPITASLTLGYRFAL